HQLGHPRPVVAGDAGVVLREGVPVERHLRMRVGPPEEAGRLGTERAVTERRPFRGTGDDADVERRGSHRPGPWHWATGTVSPSSSAGPRAAHPWTSTEPRPRRRSPPPPAWTSASPRPP